MYMCVCLIEHICSPRTTLPHLWREHMVNSIHGPFKHEPAHQEAEEDHVGEEGAEVHHLTMMKNTSPRYYGYRGAVHLYSCAQNTRQSISQEDTFLQTLGDYTVVDKDAHEDIVLREINDSF